MLEPGNINGSEGGLLLGLGPAFRYDTRSNAIYPESGQLVNLGILVQKIGDFDYTSYTVDLRQYLSLGNARNVLAMQVNGAFLSGNDVPFYRLPQVGGSDRLRGIANESLFRDRQALYAQIEYRREWLAWLGSVVFAGTGQVMGQFDEFAFNRFKYVGGIGLRYRIVPQQKLNLRFDFGVSGEGQTAFYVSIGEAF